MGPAAAARDPRGLRGMNRRVMSVPSIS